MPAYYSSSHVKWAGATTIVASAGDLLVDWHALSVSSLTITSDKAARIQITAASISTLQLTLKGEGYADIATTEAAIVNVKVL